MSDELLELVFAGDPYTVRCADADVASAIARWSAPFRVQHRAPGAITIDISKHPLAIRVDGEPLRRTLTTAADLLPAYEGVLYERLARPSRGLTVVHAAVAARRSGAALFIGDSGAGKSVLSLRLARRNWTYLSDEFAPLDSEGWVYAVPRPVAFDEAELPDPLWRELSVGLTTWTESVPGRDGRPRRMLFALAARRAEPQSRYRLNHIFRLIGRAGAAPRLVPLSAAERRAWLAGTLVLAGRAPGGPGSPTSSQIPP